MDTVYSKPSATGDAGLPDSAPEPSLPPKIPCGFIVFLSLSFDIRQCECVPPSFHGVSYPSVNAPELMLHHLH